MAALKLILACRVVILKISQRVHILNNHALGDLLQVIAVQVWGEYMMIRYLDPTALDLIE